MDNLVIQMLAPVGREAASKVTGLEEKISISMRAVISADWMCAGDDALLRAGIGGALLDVGEDSDDGKRIVRSLDLLRKFSMFLSAAQAGLSVKAPEMDGDENPLPILGLFHKAKERSK